MTSRPQVRINSDGYPYVLVTPNDLPGGRRWVGLIPHETAGGVATDVYYERDGDILAPAVVLTEDDAEELGRITNDADDALGERGVALPGDWGREVIRRLIDARKDTP